jgi:tRNA threonylcarbamoyladenosine biosynthesis protein TsaE
MIITTNLEEIETIVDYLLPKTTEHTIILLNGTLASGKTTLVSQIVNKLGLKDCVTSPTFSICSVYDSRVYHYDIYNSSSDDFVRLGLLQQLDTPALHIIEWADKKLVKLIESYGWHKIEVNIKILNNKREYEVIDEQS